MKKYTFLLLVLAIFQKPALAYEFFSVSKNTRPEQPTMAIFVDGLALVGASLDSKYVLKMGEHGALSLPFAVGMVPFSYVNGGSSLSAKVGAGFQYYVIGEALSEGLYADLSLSGGYSMLTPPNLATIKSLFLRPQLLVGYSYVIDERFVFSAALGASYNLAFAKEAQVIKKAYPEWKDRAPYALAGLVSGFLPRAELSIGYRF